MMKMEAAAMEEKRKPGKLKWWLAEEPTGHAQAESIRRHAAELAVGRGSRAGGTGLVVGRNNPGSCRGCNREREKVVGRAGDGQSGACGWWSEPGMQAVPDPGMQWREVGYRLGCPACKWEKMNSAWALSKDG
ncbi:hypothetical protein Dimus_029575 [Dionaea muscipula]